MKRSNRTRADTHTQTQTYTTDDGRRRPRSTSDNGRRTTVVVDGPHAFRRDGGDILRLGPETGCSVLLCGQRASLQLLLLLLLRAVAVIIFTYYSSTCGSVEEEKTLQNPLSVSSTLRSVSRSRNQRYRISVLPPLPYDLNALWSFLVLNAFLVSPSFFFFLFHIRFFFSKTTFFIPRFVNSHFSLPYDLRWNEIRRTSPGPHHTGMAETIHQLRGTYRYRYIVPPVSPCCDFMCCRFAGHERNAVQNHRGGPVSGVHRPRESAPPVHSVRRTLPTVLRKRIS